MHNKIVLMANVNRSQIDITATHYNIKSIPITVDDAIMNDIMYSKAENAKGMPTMVGNPVTLGHPSIEGQSASGQQGAGLDDYYSGGTIKRTYNRSGVWYADASIKKSLLNAQDGGAEYAEMLENKESIGVSTGLIFDDNEIAGTNNSGQSYSKTAINQVYDHLAMLASEAPAGGADTVMRFNVADILPVEKDGWTKKALNLFKGMFKTNEASHDEIHSKLYRKLNEGKSDEMQHSWPMEVYSSSFIYRGSNDILYKQSYGMDDDEVVFTSEPIKVERVIEYKPVTNNTNDDGDVLMLEKIKAKLTAANVKTEGLDNDALLEAYNTLLTPAPVETPAPTPTELTAQITAVVNAAIKPLQDKITTNADAELDAVSTKVAALDMGVDAVAAKAMGVDACNSFLAKNSGAVAFNASNGRHANRTDNKLDNELPE